MVRTVRVNKQASLPNKAISIPNNNKDKDKDNKDQTKANNNNNNNKTNNNNKAKTNSNSNSLRPLHTAHRLRDEARERKRGLAKSGRVWKQKQEKRSSAIRQTKPLRNRAFELKMKRRAQLKKTQEMSRAIKAQLDAKREADKKRIEQRKKQREENLKKGMVVQRITDTRKIKKLTRKQLGHIMKM